VKRPSKHTRITKETLVAHRNAPLTPEGRRRLCERVDAGRPICHVAAEAGIARQTLAKWHARWLLDGEDGLQDRSSRPESCPRRTDPQIEDLIEWLRRGTMLGPVMLVAELAEFGVTMATSTIHRVLVRRGISRLRDLDVNGEDMREKPKPHRYEHPVCGDMVHVDVKKIGRIPDGGGWRVHGKGTDEHRASKRGQRPGYAFLHTAIDDRSRLAYTEELADEKSITAADFWERAVEFFAAHGIERIARVLTDNGSCYRGKEFNNALGSTVHKFTRPYTPRTNGKVERFNRTLAREWAYRQAWSSNDERTAALPGFLHRYNYHRPHTALKGRPPVYRTSVVTNLYGCNT
jgi:transposase InsO family protein